MLTHSDGKEMQRRLFPNTNLLTFYRQLIQLRNEHRLLRTGGFEFTLLDDQRQLIAFRRQSADNHARVLAAFNASDQQVTVSPGDMKLESLNGWKDLWTDLTVTTQKLDIPPHSFAIVGQELH